MMTPDDWGDYCYRARCSTSHTALTKCCGAAHATASKTWKACTWSAVERTRIRLPVIFESARISSKLVLDDLGIVPDWNGVSVWFDSVRRSKNGRRALKSIGAPRPHKGGEPTA